MVEKIGNTESQITLNDKAINTVAQKIADKTGCTLDKAKTELGIGFVLGIMMNRHKAQEMKEDYTK